MYRPSITRYIPLHPLLTFRNSSHSINYFHRSIIAVIKRLDYESGQSIPGIFLEFFTDFFFPDRESDSTRSRLLSIVQNNSSQEVVPGVATKRVTSRFLINGIIIPWRSLCFNRVGRAATE